ncbi:glucosamine 6-phosphate N-acetyltransferase [Tanacetum coccineum]
MIEDVSRSKIVATGSVFIEKKFVRSCGKAGHIEDVVVDSSARGMQLGKKVIGFLADHARSMGCYKKCLSDETLAIPLDEIQIDDKLHFIEEPVDTLDREVKHLTQSRIPNYESTLEFEKRSRVYLGARRPNAEKVSISFR